MAEVNSTDYSIIHPYIGYLARPNSSGIIRGRDFKAVYHIDSHGFRNSWPWPDKAEIVVVGDSVVFGYGVEDMEAWPALLALAMPQNRVVNLGLIGASPQQYSRVYEVFGKPLQPKVALVGMLLANDFWDAMIFDRWLASKAPGNYLTWRKEGRFRLGQGDHNTAIKAVLREHSYVYNLVHNVYKTWRLGRVTTLKLAEEGRLQLVPSLLGSSTARGQPDRPEFQLVLKALVGLHALASQQGARVLVVFQPSKEQVYLPLLGELAPDPSAPLRAALHATGIDYLDLTAAFRQHARAGKRLFFEGDGHPNKQGYQLIAQEVLGHLTKNAVVYGLQTPL
jgi:lysophospholipase L1-like esterase